MRPTVAISALVLILLLTLAAACGEDGGESGQTGEDGTATFDISLRDEMTEEALVSFFIPNELTVGAGQEVTFNLSNDGTLPHNFRIAGPDGEYNSEDDFLVGPDILYAGEVAVQRWTSPTEAGTLIFRCDFHPDSVGTITIE